MGDGLSQFNNVLVYVLLGAGFVKLMLNLWIDASSLALLSTMPCSPRQRLKSHAGNSSPPGIAIGTAWHRPRASLLSATIP
jgi:hypothetical protein